MSSKRSPILKVVEGIKPPSTLSSCTVAKVTAKIKNVFIPQEFNSKSHGQYFKNLLWIEEFRIE